MLEHGRANSFRRPSASNEVHVKLYKITIPKRLFMFMENKDLPAYGQAFAWMLTFVAGAFGVLLLAIAAALLMQI